jgi:uncharacterized membrane protein
MTSIDSTAATHYATAVRAALADLTPDQLHAIVDGLDEHLAEVAADGSTDLVDALGPPTAYAAELRSSAGLPSVATPEATEASPVAIEPLATDVVVADDRPRWVIAARVAITAVLALLLILVVRISDPVNGLQVVLGAAAVGVGWWVLHLIGKRAQLPAAWTTRMPLVLGAAAIVGAVLVGAQLAGSNREVVFVPNVEPPVTASPAPQISATMPDVIGRTVLEARRVLESAGFVVFIAGNPNVPDLLGQIVASTDPAPGAIVVVGTQVTLVAFDAISTSVVPSTAVTATTVVSSATSTLPTASTISNSTSTVP